MSTISKTLSLALVALCAACVSTQGKKIESDQYASFEEGKTTRSQIIAALGEPNSTSFVGNDEVLDYKFQKTDNKAMIPIVGPFMGVKVDLQLCSFTVGGKSAVLKAKQCSAAKSSASALGGG